MKKLLEQELGMEHCYWPTQPQGYKRVSVIYLTRTISCKSRARAHATLASKELFTRVSTLTNAQNTQRLANIEGNF